jgi:hypothetical protein
VGRILKKSHVERGIEHPHTWQITHGLKMDSSPTYPALPRFVTCEKLIFQKNSPPGTPSIWKNGSQARRGEKNTVINFFGVRNFTGKPR